MFKYKLSQLDLISKKILLRLSKTDCIYLIGELGSGKTTFARSLIHQLQEKNKVKKTDVPSPTFNLLHEYQIKSLKVMHYDLYRIEKNSEVEQLGILNEQQGKIRIIEWPEKIEEEIDNRLEIRFYHAADPEDRELKYRGYGKWKSFKLNAI